MRGLAQSHTASKQELGQEPRAIRPHMAGPGWDALAMPALYLHSQSRAEAGEDISPGGTQVRDREDGTPPPLPVLGHHLSQQLSISLSQEP